MMNGANQKVQVVLKQQSETNAGTLTSDAIDTLGYDAVTILVHGTTSNNATNNPSVLSIKEGDTTSSYAAITALTGDGVGGFTIPNSPTATTTAAFAMFNLDTRARKRYLQVLISPVTTQTYSVVALLNRSEQAPTSTTALNAAVVVNG
jgi:hypothetical protein